MKVNIEVNNKTQSPVEDSFFVEVAQRTLDEANLDFLAGKEVSISVALVDEDEMRRLNKEYRSKDGVTDILSFSEHENTEELEKNTQPEVFLGELILCYNDIYSYAEDENMRFENELAKVFSHGVLHLLGFSHGEKMFGIQEKVTKSLSK